jgi:flagellar P-ring protein precursor FlgI
MNQRWYVVFFSILYSVSAQAERIKDLADVLGARPNQLVGYGIVAGLSNTGDDFTTRMAGHSIAAMLRRLGVNVDDQQMRLRNVAAVMVTAEMPAFTAPGQRLNVNVSSIGNARSLLGGTLLMTSLKGADLKVYAVAQGALLVGGVAVSGQTGSTSQRNTPTAGSIPGGALVERAIDFEMPKERIQWTLKKPDFTTASRMGDVILKMFQADTREDVRSAVVQVPDAGTVYVDIPSSYKNTVPSLIAALENIELMADIMAKVVVNEKTGTVVLGEGVRLRPVAVAHGSMRLEVQEFQLPSQPNALSSGQTTVVQQSDVSFEDEKTKLVMMKNSANLSDVVDALNALGVSSRDLISILQALKASGSLRAELEIL